MGKDVFARLEQSLGELKKQHGRNKKEKRMAVLPDSVLGKLSLGTFIKNYSDVIIAFT